MLIKVPFKKISFAKIIFKENKQKEITPTLLDNLAMNFPFKRCPSNMISSLGFIPFYENGESENSLTYHSYKNKFTFFNIMEEVKKISKSEIDFEVNEEKKRALNEENVILTKEDIVEIREKIENEKIKTAPSSFKKHKLGFDDKGNLIINSTSSNVIDSISKYLFFVFSEYIENIIVNAIHRDISETFTSIVKNNSKLPESTIMGLGSKGEGKNKKTKLSFNEISTDSNEIVEMTKKYDLDITKLELFLTKDNSTVGFYVSDSGLESFVFSESFNIEVESECENLKDDFEKFDTFLDIYIKCIFNFERELLHLVDKIYNNGNMAKIFDITFNSLKDYTKFKTE